MTTSTPDPAGTVVLCGSVTRAVAALDAAEAHYLALGYRVHKPVADDSRTPEEHAERWYALIDAADVVVACTMQGDDLGEQTRRELDRAFDFARTVRLWVEATPEPVSSAPDTEARQQAVDAIESELDLARSGEGYEANAVAEEIVRRYWPDVAGLRADLDQALRERDEAQRQEAAWRASAQESDKGLTLYAREVRRLRAELAGARTIPDDAAERAALRMFRVHVYGTLTSERHDASARNQWVKVLDEDDRETWRKLARELLADLGATPTTDPAPAAAGRPRWVQRGLHHHRCAVRAGAADCTCGVEPAAPQAPAEPTEETAFGALLAAAGDLDGGTDADRRLAEHIRSAVAEVAREDAATPPLPLHEQADLLTWRVVHVPPGTTDREDTDTPITPGWWLVGHGDDPDHPDVQVHLGDRLPTSSAATPGDEYNDDPGGWVRPTPIQPEEA